MHRKPFVAATTLFVVLLILSGAVLADPQSFLTVYPGGIRIGEAEGEGVAADTLQFTNNNARIRFDGLNTGIDFGYDDEGPDDAFGIFRGLGEGQENFLNINGPVIDVNGSFTLTQGHQALFNVGYKNNMLFNFNGPGDEGAWYQALFLAQTPWVTDQNNPVFDDGVERISTTASLFSASGNVAIGAVEINNDPEVPEEEVDDEGEGDMGFDLLGGLFVYGDPAGETPRGTVEMRNTSKAGVRVTTDGSVIVTLGE